MNVNVTVKYRLSAAGQRAALVAGRPATSTATETMTIDDPALLDHLTIQPDGSLVLDVTGYPGGCYHSKLLYLDAPPSSIKEVLQLWGAYSDEVKAAREAEAAAERARQEEAARKAAEKAAHDAPLVEALLSELEALDPLADLPAGISLDYFGTLERDRYRYTQTQEQITRAKALYEKRNQARADAKAAAKRAEQEAREAMVAEHGGYLWQPEAGMCDFLGFGLWCSGQSRRWVGIFTQPKGIERFLDSPRGEFTWEIGSLQRGDCIQGGGFDTNSRGKRRNQTEWFGVVIRNDDSGLVVKICDSRAAALAAAKKL